MALVGSTFLAPVTSLPADQLRSVAPPSGAAPAAAAGSASGSGAVLASAALGVAALALPRDRRARRAARRFFGQAPVSQSPPKPLALPMLPEPAYRSFNDPLLQEMDAGFDPLNLATTPSPWGDGKDGYFNYREAEVKHGRLAMLASVGWLTSEELQGALARKFGLPDDLAPGELAPSLINGGLGNLPGWFLPAVFAVSAWIELVPRQQGNREELLKYKPSVDRVPGDLGFDPLDLQPTLRGMGFDITRLHNAEVKHGRAAMIAITAFVVQEFVTGVDVLTEDELSADRLVAGIDKSIDAVDKVTGLTIPDIPMPFPGF